MCQAYCGYEVRVEDGRITRLRGDKSDPLSEGYACFKGLKHLELYDSKDRLLRSLRRSGDGFEAAASETLIEEAGDKLQEIVSRHGPESVGFFIGTQALFNSAAPPMIRGFAEALGTPRLFTTMTIDQSAKWIGEFRLGSWAAGSQSFDTADVWMFVGANPVNSMSAGGGCNLFAFSNPIARMERARKRGMKIIVVDPRLTETAKFADIHLQLRPGTDVKLAGALLHVILAEGWQDSGFCAEYVEGLDDLREAVAAWSPEAIEEEVGISALRIREAADLFARQARSGMVGTGTGPDMAAASNLAEHLYQAINVVCGRFPRSGEAVPDTRVLRPALEPRAEVVLPPREWESGPRTLRKGLGRMKGTMMSAELAHEILHPSEKRMRALICVGGNPAVALPDQSIAQRALADVELLITIDPLLTATARLADYVFAPRLHYERADFTMGLEHMFTRPFAHLSPAIVDPPPGSDVVDDWYVLLRLAERLGLSIRFGDEALPEAATLNTMDLLRRLAAGSAIPFDAVLEAEGALSPQLPPSTVAPRKSATRFQLLPQDVAEELGTFATRFWHAGDEGFRLIVRRNKDTMNSTGSLVADFRRRFPSNPVYVHPSDMERLDVENGDWICVTSSAGEMRGAVRADDSLQPGVIAVSHGWSSDPDRPELASNVFVDAEAGIEPINAMPIMTGIRVSISRADTAAENHAAVLADD